MNNLYNKIAAFLTAGFIAVSPIHAQETKHPLEKKLERITEFLEKNKTGSLTGNSRALSRSFALIRQDIDKDGELDYSLLIGPPGKYNDSLDSPTWMMSDTYKVDGPGLDFCVYNEKVGDKIKRTIIDPKEIKLIMELDTDLDTETRKKLSLLRKASIMYFALIDEIEADLDKIRIAE